MHHASLGEEHPDAAVEHSSVEVLIGVYFALIPRPEHERVLIFDGNLLFGVVGIDDILPVGEVEEVVSLVDHVVEVVVCIPVVAASQRSAPVIL